MGLATVMGPKIIQRASSVVKDREGRRKKPVRLLMRAYVPSGLPGGWAVRGMIEISSFGYGVCGGVLFSGALCDDGSTDMMGRECLVDGGLSQPFILSFMAGLCLPIVYIPPLFSALLSRDESRLGVEFACLTRAGASSLYYSFLVSVSG